MRLEIYGCTNFINIYKTYTKPPSDNKSDVLPLSRGANMYSLAVAFLTFRLLAVVILETPDNFSVNSAKAVVRPNENEICLEEKPTH